MWKSGKIKKESENRACAKGDFILVNYMGLNWDKYLEYIGVCMC